MDEIKQLYDFMKENYVIKAKWNLVELELHPLAFTKQIEAELKIEDEIDYDKFIYPKKTDLELQGL